MKHVIAALAIVAVIASDARADSIPPFGPGPNPVGCSNVVQDFTRVPMGDSAQDYWEGKPAGSTHRYITDLLADPANTVTANLAIPDDGGLYGQYAAQSFPYVVLVCYPTSNANARPDYPLPTGDVVPHMQRGGEAPIFADAAARYPILLFSHGLTGSPLSGDYLDAVRLFASWGYVVVAPFHGDLRFADIKLDSFSDYFYALVNIKDFVAMQAVRPLSLSLGLDSVLAGNQFADHVDVAKVGGFGASLGGESLLLMAGAQLTTTIGQAYKQVTFDPRLKAAATYVPYFGQVIFPAFGRDQSGLQDVTLPFLAISGTADTTAPIAATEKGFGFLTNSRQLVALTDVEHGFNPAFSDEIFTWSLAFLAGQLSGDPAARATSARMTSVAGGGEDVLKSDYIAPSPAQAGERIVIEFRNDALNHYFITAESAESALLDAGVVIPGWERTRFNFKAWDRGDPRGLPACRFFGTPGIGPNSHFYTISDYECWLTKANPYWLYEGIAFNSDASAGEVCAADRVPVVRLYNNGMGGQASHRFVTSHSEVREMVQRGWMVEGVVFCSIP